MSLDIGWLPVGALILFVIIFVVRVRFQMRRDFDQKPSSRWGSLIRRIIPSQSSIKWVMVGFLVGSFAVFVFHEIWLWLYSTPFPFNPFLK